jgi:hypothetical protein
MVCETPNLGRLKKVGLFLLDDCLAPIHAPGAGYLDDCFAGLETSDNVNEGDDFTRTCANGDVKYFQKGTQSLQDIDVNVDLHWLDPDWIAQAGGAQPVMHNGEIIGWSDCTNDRFNVLVVIEQEIIGGDACDPTSEDVGCPGWLRLYPLKGARITEQGTPGAEDNYVRLTGSTSDSHALGSGPIELGCDPLTGDPEWLSDCLPSGCHRFRFQGPNLPADCGIYDTTEEPPTPCTPAAS